MYVKKAAEKTFVQKICMFNVDEIDGCQDRAHEQQIIIRT